MHAFSLAVRDDSAKRHFMLTLVKLHAHTFQHIPCYQLNKQRHVLLLICRHNINYLEGEKKPNFTPCNKDSVFHSLLFANFSSQASKLPIYRISLPYNHNKHCIWRLYSQPEQVTC